MLSLVIFLSFSKEILSKKFGKCYIFRGSQISTYKVSLQLRTLSIPPEDPLMAKRNFMFKCVDNKIVRRKREKYGFRVSRRLFSFTKPPFEGVKISFVFACGEPKSPDGLTVSKTCFLMGKKRYKA